ncbi:MAG: hypothetical protein ACUVR3_09415 [Candidatus Roseilinea sp.]|uniref:hypothetical protein n=1 Tax=Candidatus Roseilinea sp. TaxID=2838777 RepID=UPI00404AE57C
MAMSPVNYGRVATCAITVLVVAGVFYLCLAGAGLPGLAALAISTLFAAMCVGFTFWSLGLRLTQDQ